MRRMRPLTPVLLLSLTLCSPSAASFWEVANNGIEARTFTDVVIDPSNSQTLYAIGPSGVFKSTNSGTNWVESNSGLSGYPFTLDIAIDPVNPQTLYVVSQFPEGGRGVWKSLNGGFSWERKSTGIHLPYINSVNVFPGNPQILYAGTNVGGASGGVFKSVNGGETWDYVAGDQAPGSGMGNDAAPIVPDPLDPQYVYCGKNSYTGFSRSTDGGAHWNWVDYSFVIKHLAVHPDDTSRIFAGGIGYLKISRDRGLTLEETEVNHSIGGIAIAPSNTDIIYAGAIGYPIYKSTDRGETWAPVGDEAHSWAALAVRPQDPDFVYAATTGEGILRSMNGGLDWQPVNDGLPGQMRVTKMVASPRAKAVWAVVDSRAMYVSYDDGASWSPLNPISGYPTDFELDPSDGTTLYLANKDILRSRDLGLTWEKLNLPVGNTITQVAVDPNDGNRIFVYDSTANRIKRSLDGGQTWTDITNITAFRPYWGNVGVSDIVVDPANSQRIYLGTLNHPWRSEDGGTTWEVLSGVEYTVIYNNIPSPTSFVRDIAIDPIQPNTVYATTQWGGTWKSNDHGDTWSRLHPPGDEGFIHNNLVFDVRDHNTIYVCTLYEGVYKSNDGGQT